LEYLNKIYFSLTKLFTKIVFKPTILNLNKEMNKLIIFQFFVLIQLFLFYEAFLTGNNDDLAEVEVL